MINIISRKSFNDVLYEWLDYKKQDVKESTYFRYLYQIETNILPNIDDISFNKLSIKHIENLFNDDDINKFSSSTKNVILIILKSSINYGISRNYRKSFENIDIKFQKQNNKVSCFTKAEQKKIIDYINENMNLRNLLILVTLFTGLRIGEVCSLKGTDVDFINKIISVKRTVQRIKDTSNSKSKTKLVIDKPKTKNSERIIPVPDFIIKLLKEYITDKNNFIFTDSNIPKDPRAVEKYFANLLKKINIKNQSFHTLRHSYATRLMEEKVDIKVISELLGHADWKITESIYVHATLDYKKHLVNKLGNMWNKRKFEK